MTSRFAIWIAARVRTIAATPGASRFHQCAELAFGLTPNGLPPYLVQPAGPRSLELGSIVVPHAHKSRAIAPADLPGFTDERTGERQPS